MEQQHSQQKMEAPKQGHTGHKNGPRPWQKPKHHHRDNRNLLLVGLFVLIGLMFICETYFMATVVKLNTRTKGNLHTVAVLKECGSPTWVVLTIDGHQVIASWNELQQSSILSQEYAGAYRVVQRNIGCGDHHGK